MKSKKWNRGLLIVLLLSSGFRSFAQSPLNRTVSLEVNHQRLDNVLEILSNKGNFYFSYNSNIIKLDSQVSISINNKTLKQILDTLLSDHYEFRESGNYIIIRKSAVTMTMVTGKVISEDKFYTISGYVLNDQTGEWIPNASIYETSLLASTLTNLNGHFKLRLKQKSKSAVLNVRKEFYQDTSFAIDAGYDQQITVTLLPVASGTLTIIRPEDFFAPEQLKLRVQTDSAITEYTYTKTDSVKVEQTAVAKFLLSSRQKIQSLNLKRFFTRRVFQVSLTPGLSTHGKLSGQVINNFSLNVFGGYNGGIEGFEVGGLFNIDKKRVEYFQTAGLFNIVGGELKGLQAAGINNTVLNNVTGVQVVGVSNIVKGKFIGFQVAGVYNHVSDSVKGMQLAGIANFAKNKISGSQISGVANFSNREITGVQISGVINYAKHLKGVQIGLINISNTSEGLSVGLISIVLKGYHKLSFSTDEVANANAAFKTGSNRLYNILQAGLNINTRQKLFTFGYGFGSELRFGKIFSINPELTAQHLYLGSWDYANILSKLHLGLHIRLNKYVSLFGGPAFNVYYSNQNVLFPDYKSVIPLSGYHLYNFDTNVKGWLGWKAGIDFF